MRTLSGWYAEKHVLYERSKVLQRMLREIVLTQKMASSPILEQWVRSEDGPRAGEQAFAELEDFRAFFRSGSYFLALASSGHYYFDDGESVHDPARPRYTLEESKSSRSSPPRRRTPGPCA